MEELTVPVEKKIMFINMILTWLRPSEKLYEEPLSKRENVNVTKKEQIYIANLKKVNEEFIKDLGELQQSIYAYNSDKLICKLQEIVPKNILYREED